MIICNNKPPTLVVNRNRYSTSKSISENLATFFEGRSMCTINDHHHHLMLTRTITILMIGFIINTPIGWAHSPPIRMNWKPHITMQHRLIAKQLAPNEYYQTSNVLPESQKTQNLLRSRLISMLTKSNNNPLKYYYRQAQQSIAASPPLSALAPPASPLSTQSSPSLCEKIGYLQAIKQVLLDSDRAQINKQSDDQIDNEQQRSLKTQPKALVQLMPNGEKKLVGKFEQEKVDRMIDPAQKSIGNGNDNKWATSKVTNGIWPYGIVRTSPSSARKGSILKPNELNGGYFGEFLEEIISTEKNNKENQQRYLNGFNVRSGKEGIKISKTKHFEPVRHLPSESMSLLSPSFSSSSLSSSMSIPGIFTKPFVKPSIRLAQLRNKRRR